MITETHEAEADGAPAPSASARARAREWIADPGSKITVALGVMAIAYLIWQHTGLGRSHRQLISDAWFLPMSLVGAIFAWRTARASRGDARTRQAWIILGAAFFCYWVGDSLWFYFENFRSSPPFPSLADVGYLAFYPLLMIGLLRFPIAARGKIDRAKFWLDSGTVLLSALMVVWFFVLGPTARQHTDSFFAKAISLAYPVGDLVIVFGIAGIIIRGPAESCRRVLAVLGIGMALFVIADIGFGYQSLNSGYSGGDWPDSLWMIAQFLMLVAAQYHFMRMRLDRDEGPKRHTPGSRVSRLPYAAILIAFGLLLYVGRHQSLYPLGGLIFVSVVITALVLARQVTVMRDNGRLMNALQTAATTDSLTGLRNRGDFFDAAEMEFERLKRFDIPFVAMMLDVDHFKEVNDRYGHAAGDAVLRAVAATCMRRMRGLDIIGRYGGDELVALLPKIDIEGGLAVAERVGVAVRGTPVLYADEVIPISLSIGLASSEGVENITELLHRADLGLYAAKQAGRNCARAFAGEVPVESI